MEMSDRAVIEEMRKGNINLFEILVDRYSTKIKSYISSRLFDKMHVDDIVQDSFIQFYKAISNFDIRKPVYPYLLQIARNELYMFFRKNQITVPLNDEVTYRGEDKGNTEDISEIVEGLKADHKNALLWFAEGYSYQEIAHRLKKPLNTVRTLIRRARLFIQKNYKREQK